MRTLEIFKELCKVPHGSGNTSIISNLIEDYAKRMNLKYVKDASNNIVIYKAASPGYEDHPGVILQAHMDMVCEKDESTVIDFENEGLRLISEGDYLYADGTTLGGDDCIGVAMALAVLEDEELKHPPICSVFTVDEEIGMLGAAALDQKLVEGTYLLNLDSEEEGHFLVSCAGGATVTASFPITRKKAEGVVYDITVSGLCGGHSGTEINIGRANAIILLGSIISEIKKRTQCDVLSISGGAKDNAIARTATARIAVKDEDALAIVQANAYLNFTSRHAQTDPGLNIRAVKTVDAQGLAIENFDDVLRYLIAIPNGVVTQSKDVEGLVETSLNVGILTTTDSEILVTDSVRSSIKADKESLIERLKNLAEENKGHISVKGDYPAWEYKKDSVLRDTIQNIADEAGNKIIFEGIHAGLECGLFFAANPKLDIVSFGPDIFDIHTPKEKLSVSSTHRTYDFLVKLLERL